MQIRATELTLCLGLQLDLIAAEELLRLEEGGAGGDAAAALENPLDALRQARGTRTHLCLCPKHDRLYTC